MIIVNGQLAGYLNRMHEQLTSFLPDESAAYAETATAVAKSLAAMATPGISILLTRVDGKPPAESALSDALLSAGFAATTKGYLQTFQTRQDR